MSGGLTTRHSVNIVIHDDGANADISAAGMDKVVAADSRAVAVSHDVDNRQPGFANLTPVAKARERPCAVCKVQAST